MARRLFLLLLSSFIGVIISPSFLIAENNLSIKSPDFNAVETIEKTEEKTPKPTPELTPIVNTTIYNTPVTSPPVPVLPANHISIAGRNLEIVQVASTTIDSGNHVNRYGEKFLYGHNTVNVFKILYGVNPGTVFSVTLNNQTQNYQVSNIIIYEKNVEKGTLERNGKGKYMNAVAGAIDKDTGISYDLSIMTCYGTPYGNGDASHRLVIFANRI